MEQILQSPPTLLKSKSSLLTAEQFAKPVSKTSSKLKRLFTLVSYHHFFIVAVFSDEKGESQLSFWFIPSIVDNTRGSTNSSDVSAQFYLNSSFFSQNIPTSKYQQLEILSVSKEDDEQIFSISVICTTLYEMHHWVFLFSSESLKFIDRIEKVIPLISSSSTVSTSLSFQKLNFIKPLSHYFITLENNNSLAIRDEYFEYLNDFNNAIGDLRELNTVILFQCCSLSSTENLIVLILENGKIMVSSFFLSVLFVIFLVFRFQQNRDSH
jgi:hypothetical protein